jgi:DNA-binding CsgD family transcriptional regulator
VGRSADGAALDRVVRLCSAALDARTLRLELLAEFGRVVGFDAYAWLLTDPETSVGSAPLADVPCLPELPRLIRLKYLTPVNRWTGLPAGGVASLLAATRGDRARSRVWRELLADHEVGDVLSVVFRDPYGCWGFLDLWRIGAAAPAFSSREAGFLAEVVPAVTAAARRAQAATFTSTPEGRPPGPVVLLLSSELSLLAQTPQTDAYLRELVPPEGGAAPVPAGAYNVGAQLLAVEAAVDGNPPVARVHLRAGQWLSLRAARLAETPEASRDAIAVTIEPASPAERRALFCRSCALTARETELVGHLATGGDTRDVAHRMGLSEHTVQDHLKSVFTKTATRSRRDLLARITGA